MKSVVFEEEGQTHVGMEPEGNGCQQCVDGCRIAMPYLSFLQVT